MPFPGAGEPQNDVQTLVRHQLGDAAEAGPISRYSISALIRWTVPDPTPNSTAIFNMPLSPLARAFLMLASVLAAILGRPRVLPLARARLSPALTRLTIIDRSNWAKTPHIWNIASPAGVEVSRACWWIQANACRMDLSKEGHEVLQGPPKSIHRPRGDKIEIAACCAAKHAVEGWAPVAVFGAADAVIAKLLDDLPTKALSHGQQLAALVLYALSVGAYPSVDRYALVLGHGVERSP